MKPALRNGVFYQAMLTIQTLGTAVVPGNRQLDHALELADDAKKVARATETVKILKRKAMDKDNLADRRYNFCYKKFREVHDNEWKDKKFHRPKYYVRMLEEKEERKKGSLDDIFLNTNIMAKWMKRFEREYNLPCIADDAVCGICGKGDDASGYLFQCDAALNEKTRTPCERLEHARCAGYPDGEHPSVTLHANKWHEEKFCCSVHRGEFLSPRNSAAAKAEDAERDEEMIDAAMASDIQNTTRTERRQLTREFTKNSKKRQYVVEKEAKKKVPEAPKIFLLGNGGAAGAQSVDLVETEVVPNPKARGQFINRTKWTCKKYHKTLTQNKEAGAEPHVILMMHKQNSSDDVTFWRRKFLLQWHPDKHLAASVKTKKRIDEMSAIFIEAADRFLQIIKRREEEKDTNADKHDADILAQQEAANPFDSSDEEETTDDEA